MYIDMKKAGNWPHDRSQNMGSNDEIFRAMRAVRDCVWDCLGALYNNLFNKLCFGVHKTGNG